MSTYEYDTTGTLAANAITDEAHVLTAANSSGYLIIIPDFAPYFQTSLVVKRVTAQGTTTLSEGVDYYCGHRFALATLQLSKAVYGSIQIIDSALTGTYKISYQTLGGDYTLSEATIVSMLASALTDPVTTTWEQLVGIPLYVAAVAHLHDISNMKGYDEQIAKLEEIRLAILSAGSAALAALQEHIEDHNNPHQLTLELLGFDDATGTFIRATDAAAVEGTAVTGYMVPYTTKLAIDALGVPASRTINGKALSSDITLTAADLGITLASLGAASSSLTINSKALSSNITLTASDLGITIDSLGGVPTSRTINGFSLAANRTLTAENVGAVPTTRTINGKALSTDIVLAVGDIGAVPTTRTINGQTLDNDILITAESLGITVEGMGFVPNTRTVNGHALDADIVISASDVSLGQVQNLPMATAAVALGGASTEAYMNPLVTSLLVAQMIDGLSSGGSGESVYFTSSSTIQVSGSGTLADPYSFSFAPTADVEIDVNLKVNGVVTCDGLDDTTLDPQTDTDYWGSDKWTTTAGEWTGDVMWWPMEYGTIVVEGDWADGLYPTSITLTIADVEDVSAGGTGGSEQIDVYADDIVIGTGTITSTSQTQVVINIDETYTTGSGPIQRILIQGQLMFNITNLTMSFA